MLYWSATDVSQGCLGAVILKAKADAGAASHASCQGTSPSVRPCWRLHGPKHDYALQAGGIRQGTSRRYRGAATAYRQQRSTKLMFSTGTSFMALPPASKVIFNQPSK